MGRQTARKSTNTNSARTNGVGHMTTFKKQATKVIKAHCTTCKLQVKMIHDRAHLSDLKRSKNTQLNIISRAQRRLEQETESYNDICNVYAYHKEQVQQLQTEINQQVLAQDNDN